MSAENLVFRLRETSGMEYGSKKLHIQNRIMVEPSCREVSEGCREVGGGFRQVGWKDQGSEADCKVQAKIKP